MFEFKPVSDPIEEEVLSALGGYKMVLIRTGYNSLWHRFCCWVGDKDSLSLERSLRNAEKHFPRIINKSPQHLAAFDLATRKMQALDCGDDKFLKYLKNSLRA